MAAAAIPFPDLDLALAVSRVEVVSNVEIETIKTALRWLFDEAQNQRTAGTADPVTAQEKVDELNRVVQDQQARLKAIEEQQVHCRCNL